MRAISPEEKIVLDHLTLAWAGFVRLPSHHPSDLAEFQLAIHQLQNLIAFRVARRVDPDVWSDSTV